MKETIYNILVVLVNTWDVDIIMIIIPEFYYYYYYLYLPISYNI